MPRPGLSALYRYVTCNKWVWDRLPTAVIRTRPAQSYARLLHRVVRTHTDRRQYFGTYFFRNRPQLALISRLAERIAVDAGLSMAFLGCSSGAEVYSVLWTVRSARPDLKITATAVDISKEILALAEQGVYSLAAHGLVATPIFARTTPAEMRQMFDLDLPRNTATIKPWLKDGITWHHGDAASVDTLLALGPQDIVVASNFLCHMTPSLADACLRTAVRLVRPRGYLVVPGIDLDVRTQAARELGWLPIPDSLEDIHDGDPSVRGDWPWKYWGLEPLNKRRPDWEVRYASVFQVPAHRTTAAFDQPRPRVAPAV